MSAKEASLMALVTSKALRRSESGFSLLGVMVSSLGIMSFAGLLLPVRGPSSEQTLRRFGAQLVEDLRETKLSAGAAREARILRFQGPSSYEIGAPLPQSPSLAGLRSVALPKGIEVAGLTLGAVTAKESGPGWLIEGKTADLRFAPARELQVRLDDGTPYYSSATVFLRSTDGRARGRITVYQNTTYARFVEGW
jgi:hypothetical protein